jgi:hypothetical protein
MRQRREGSPGPSRARWPIAGPPASPSGSWQTATGIHGRSGRHRSGPGPKWSILRTSTDGPCMRHRPAHPRSTRSPRSPREIGACSASATWPAASAPRRGGKCSASTRRRRASRSRDEFETSLRRCLPRPSLPAAASAGGRNRPADLRAQNAGRDDAAAARDARRDDTLRHLAVRGCGLRGPLAHDASADCGRPRLRGRGEIRSAPQAKATGERVLIRCTQEFTWAFRVPHDSRPSHRSRWCRRS